MVHPAPTIGSTPHPDRIMVCGSGDYTTFISTAPGKRHARAGEENFGRSILASSRQRRQISRWATLVWQFKDHPRRPPLSSGNRVRRIPGGSETKNRGTGRGTSHVRRSVFQLFEAPHAAAFKQQGKWLGPVARIPVSTSRLPPRIVVECRGHRRHRRHLFRR